ncbi:MAG: ABC transporter permease [Lachnospiraceae bacterium]|nr:ABC transporter permease [Lachnospiraceae bacterium]
MKILVKSTLKILLRMKSFWFFLLLTPILSTVLLNMKQSSLAYYVYEDSYKITDLSSFDEKLAYYAGNGQYVVKVYDFCESELSEYYLTKLSASGMFRICRVKMSEQEETVRNMEAVEAEIELEGFKDRKGASLVIPREFDSLVAGGDIEKAARLYIQSDDTRTEIFKYEMALQLQKIGNAAGELSALKSADSQVPKREVIRFSVEKGHELTHDQIDKRTRMGYALAIMTMGFVFGGVFISHIAIGEQKDSVLKRIRLSNTQLSSYFVSKLLASFLVSVLITGVMAVCSFFIDMEGLGMNRIEFLGLIFLMGLIFSSLSLMMGILFGDVMSANVAAFTLWSLSSMLSGLYFPLTYTTNTLKILSKLMPQTWFMDGTEMIFTGDKTVLIMLLCVTVAYLVLIISLGSLGLKVKKVDEWGNA